MVMGEGRDTGARSYHGFCSGFIAQATARILYKWITHDAVNSTRPTSESLKEFQIPTFGWFRRALRPSRHDFSPGYYSVYVRSCRRRATLCRCCVAVRACKVLEYSALYSDALATVSGGFGKHRQHILLYGTPF